MRLLRTLHAAPPAHRHGRARPGPRKAWAAARS
ncbi:hypothetical protein [Achromobacter phage CF418P1]|nr:hypothetical protein [Achromobacter phage CF418P1]